MDTGIILKEDKGECVFSFIPSKGSAVVSSIVFNGQLYKCYLAIEQSNGTKTSALEEDMSAHHMSGQTLGIVTESVERGP